MPCHVDPPSYLELETQNVAQLTIFLNEKLGIETPEGIQRAAKNLFGNSADIRDMGPELCSKLKKLTKTQMKNWVYNAHDSMSRKLADWWESHQAEDKKHLEADIKSAKEEAAKQAAIKKLTPYEKKLLRL